MPYSREQLQEIWVKDKPVKDFEPLVRGRTYFGHEIPEQVFVIEEWCMKQGGSPRGSRIPDLSNTFQGLEYILLTASGVYSKALGKQLFEPSEIQGMMSYLNRERDFQGGALRQFPDYQKMIKKALLELPRGPKVIKAVQKIEKFSDLFRE